MFLEYCECAKYIVMAEHCAKICVSKQKSATENTIFKYLINPTILPLHFCNVYIAQKCHFNNIISILDTQMSLKYFYWVPEKCSFSYAVCKIKGKLYHIRKQVLKLGIHTTGVVNSNLQSPFFIDHWYIV